MRYRLPPTTSAIIKGTANELSHPFEAKRNDFDTDNKRMFLYILSEVKGPAISTSEFLYSLLKPWGLTTRRGVPKRVPREVHVWENHARDRKTSRGSGRRYAGPCSYTARIAADKRPEQYIKEKTRQSACFQPSFSILQLSQDRLQVVNRADGAFLWLVIAFIFHGQPTLITASF